MSALPEQYRKYAAPTGQRPLYPAEIELYAEADPIVWVPDAYGQMVPMRRSQAPAPIQAAPPRDPTPQPLFDPGAQKILATGVGAGVALWGGGQFLIGAGQLVSSLSGMGALLFFLALAGGRAMLARPQGGKHVEVHNHVRGFGRSTTNL